MPARPKPQPAKQGSELNLGAVPNESTKRVPVLNEGTRGKMLFPVRVLSGGASERNRLEQAEKLMASVGLNQSIGDQSTMMGTGQE